MNSFLNTIKSGLDLRSMQRQTLVGDGDKYTALEQAKTMKEALWLTSEGYIDLTIGGP